MKRKARCGQRITINTKIKETSLFEEGKKCDLEKLIKLKLDKGKENELYSCIHLSHTPVSALLLP